MPNFDLRGIKVARYSLTDTGGTKTVIYTERTSAGDAMSANLEIRFAEGRLYAESSLAEYLRKAVGGTISLAVKYIPLEAQKLMYGVTEKSRNISYTPAGSQTSTTEAIQGIVTSSSDRSSYVGVAFYAPDMIDGEEKYTCVHIKKASFGNPALAYQTRGESITFNTPTTTGEFLPDGTAQNEMLEIAIVDDVNAAVAWVDEVLDNAA